MARAGMHQNIILIGMPGSGKSTIGVILAKNTSRNFVDTDILIQESDGRMLQDIVDTEGYMALRDIEERILLGLSLTNHVIATGGSAVYSEKAMTALKAGGPAVFLDVTIGTLMARISDFSTRGLAKKPEQDIGELFTERLELYRKYADITICCDSLTQEQACASIAAAIAGWRTAK